MSSNNVIPISEKTSDRGGNVRDTLILVAAEHFAEHGFQGASQRAIQREVGVNNSTANYYFGSKDALYRAVVEEALAPIQAERRAGLDAALTNLSPHAQVRALLEAYFAPHLRAACTDYGYNYVRILASLHLVVPDAAAEVVEELVTPVRELYVDALAKLFPDASRNRIYEVLRMVVGLMAMAPIRLGVTHLSEQVMEQTLRDIVEVATIAFEALCDQG